MARSTETGEIVCFSTPQCRLHAAPEATVDLSYAQLSVREMAGSRHNTSMHAQGKRTQVREGKRA